ncbi:protein MFI isoform X5 [Cavia porcellus]
MSQQKEFTKQDRAARIIQRAWRTCLAEFLDAAAGVHVRFRLGGAKFPPDIYYKIFTHRHIEDLCANSPRDYTKCPAKRTSPGKGRPQEEDHSGWYRRVENNGWRPVSERFWMPAGSEVVEDRKESEFHFSKLKRRQDLERKRKIRKIEWMRQMYYAGSLEAKSAHYETVGLIHTATKGLIRAMEDGGVDSVMEWEVDEVLNWTNTLNFDEYIADWKQIATSKSSVKFRGFNFEQAKKNIHDYKDESEARMGAPYILSENVYEKPHSTRLTPESS